MNWTTYILVSLVKTVVALLVLLTAVAYTVLLERKLVARIQNRWGPTRVGPFGLLQPLADGLKLLFKEDLLPAGAYKPLFILAPMLSVTAALMSIAVVPIGESFRLPVLNVETPLQITDVNIGLLFLLGVTSTGVYGIALAGWSSNSKYSLLGSLRASAQMISYELSLGLALVGVLVLAGSLSLRDIVAAQAGAWGGFIPRWHIFQGQILGFAIYLTAAFAETNRIPFDLPEGETEIVAGYHTEYSSMKFAMFLMAEYINMFTVACVATLLFLGGWHGPLFGPPALQALLPVFWFVLKVFFFIFLYIWIRGTLPRFRYDQLMAFGWKVLLPLAIANVMLTAWLVAVGKS